MADERKACLSIGIANAGGGLDYLSGAINGARDMHRWATALGYESTLLVDEPDPVDIARLKATLEALLPRGTATKRLILYFAGHGFIGRADDGLWLLSDWDTSLRAVAVEPLKRRLRDFGIEQISIIADACRTLPNNMRVAELSPDPVLGAGFTRPQVDLLVDRFIASQDGTATYMIPGETPDQDRCIFSGVLLEGLWGQAAGAFSKRAVGQVISSSLADYLRARVPEVARQYDLQMDPQAIPGFPELHDIYFDRAHAPPQTPAMPAWPAPRNAAMERVSQGSAPSIAGQLTVGSLVRAMGLGSDGGPPSGITNAIEGISLSTLLDALTPSRRLPRGGKAPKPPSPPEGISPSDWEALKARVAIAHQLPMSDGERRQADWLVERSELPSRERAAKKAAEEQNEQLREQLRTAAVPSGLREGLVIAGAKVRSVWGPPDLQVRTATQESTWTLEARVPFREGRQLVIEFEDGHFVPCTLMSGMVTRISVDPSGATGLVMQPGYGSVTPNVRTSIETGEAAIASLAGGVDIAQASDLAAHLRMEKHINPVLGVISAYLYDAVGDVESIRRMAYYYVVHRQAIPFDIVFLGDLQTSMRPDGVLLATVPTQSARKPRTPLEATLDWTTQRTPKAQGVSAGRLPWMRRGWAYIASPSDAERLMTGFVFDLVDTLTSARFTTLPADAGRRLVGMLDLEQKS